MAVMAVAGYASLQSKVSIIWEFIACGVVTIAELCVSTVGLAMAYDYAPIHMKSRVQAAFLLTTFGGNLLAMFLSDLYSSMQAGNYFSLLSLMMVAIMIVHYFVGRRFEQIQSMQSIQSVQNIAAMLSDEKT
jgi:dipeptide/tripeptide permease